MASSAPTNDPILVDVEAAAAAPQAVEPSERPVPPQAAEGKTAKPRTRAKPAVPAKPAVKAKAERTPPGKKSRPATTGAKAAAEVVAPKKAASKPAATVKKSPKPVADKKKIAAKPAVAKQEAAAKPAVAEKKSSRKSAQKASVGGKKVQAPKAKLVRDSFTMPKEDYSLIAMLKDRALGFKRPAKKSELLRAGLHVLQGLAAPALRAALEALTPLKTGRPRKDAS
ncbi:hypothetical protein WKW79_03300 [Variovorax robiniae]|uniref:Uncharacterized protein n=1 Tax=Variovorax robiniae TaxID=1836199 RepID=A0ABU8X1G3_9BURK